jgi:hypothetical protein
MKMSEYASGLVEHARIAAFDHVDFICVLRSRVVEMHTLTMTSCRKSRSKIEISLMVSADEVDARRPLEPQVAIDTMALDGSRISSVGPHITTTNLTPLPRPQPPRLLPAPRPLPALPLSEMERQEA